MILIIVWEHGPSVEQSVNVCLFHYITFYKERVKLTIEKSELY